MMRRREIALAALASAFAVGCGLSLDFGPAVQNRCTVAAQCGDGECVDGACITTSIDPAMAVVFEVVPASDALLPPRAPTVFPPVTVAGPGPVDLALPPEVIVSGRAVFGVSEMRVPVEVTFAPRPGFEGAPPGEVRVTSDANDYAALLDVGTVYDIVVQPTGAPGEELANALDLPGESSAMQVFPPLYIDGVEAGLASGALKFKYHEALFEPCTDVVHDGCTLGGRVKSVDAEGAEVFEEGLVVRAVDAAGRIVSSSSFTDETGAFALRIMSGAGDYVLRVTPPDDVVLPSVDIEVDFTVASDARQIALPRLLSVTFQQYVEYERDGETIPVNHAAIAFESTDIKDLGLPGEFSFRRTAFTSTTDAPLSPISVDLLPGSYRIVVTPADADLAGVTVDMLEVDERSAGMVVLGRVYTLSLRTRLPGTVLTPAGDSVPLAEIRARRLPIPSTVAPGDLLSFGRSSETTADAHGEFTIPLDVGTFDLVVRAGEGTGYGWQVFPDVTVVADQDDFDPMDLRIRPPVPVSGIVVDADGAPLASALVRAYVLLGSGETLRAVQVGEATTDAEGTYEVLLPGGI